MYSTINIRKSYGCNFVFKVEVVGLAGITGLEKKKSTFLTFTLKKWKHQEFTIS